MNIGNFTKKANLKQRLTKKFWALGPTQAAPLPTNEGSFQVKCVKRTNNKGKDPLMVYNIKAIPAPMRSGWYPQPKITKVMGINLSSKLI